MENDLVSVIVPIYNVETYIEKCIKSIINQTYQNLEILLVDDGSTDMSGSMCDRFANSDERIKVIHQKNMGLSGARNCGISKATGTYITFVDGDDSLKRNAIETLYSLIKKYNVNVSIGQNSVYKNLELQEKSGCNIKRYDKWSVELLKKTSVCGNLYKADLVKKYLFRENVLHEDTDWSYKILFVAKKIVVTEEIVYYISENPNSITRATYHMRRIQVFDFLLDQIDFFNKLGEMESVEYIQILYSCVILQHYEQAKKSKLMRSDLKKIKQLGNKMLWPLLWNRRASVGLKVKYMLFCLC